MAIRSRPRHGISKGALAAGRRDCRRGHGAWALLLFFLLPSVARAQLAENCDNDADDDGDSFADCGDPDCVGHPSCPPGGGVENTPRLCQNGVDDDGDGTVDCDDASCRQLIFCVGHRPSESTPARCQNGEDDDGDGRVDCADSGCAHLEVCANQERPSEERLPGTQGIYRPRTEPERTPPTRFLDVDDPRRYPQRHVRQPLTYLSGMLVPTLDLR